MMTQTIGRKLRQFRQKKGYSQETLADRAGLHPTYIGQVERGEKTSPSKLWQKSPPPWVSPFPLSVTMFFPIPCLLQKTIPCGPMSSSPAFLKKIKDAFTISCLKFAVFSNSTSHGHHRPPLPRRTAFFTAGFSIALSK